MKIGEALARTKVLKNKLLELQKLQRRTFFVEEGKSKEADFDELDREIEDAMNELRDLKLRIQRANLDTFISWKNEEVSLARAILAVGDLRSQLAHMDRITDDDRSFGIRRSPFERKTRDELEYIPQKSRKELVELRKMLEDEKTQLDNLIQNKNWQTEL